MERHARVLQVTYDLKELNLRAELKAGQPEALPSSLLTATAGEPGRQMGQDES